MAVRPGLRSARRSIGLRQANSHALVQASRLDAGRYDLQPASVVLEDPALRFLYERYESHERLNRHLQNAVLRGFLAEAATLVDGNVDIRTFRMVNKLPSA